MKHSLSRALALAATLLVAGACTDPAVAPSSTVTEDNAFKDFKSYRALLAKVYAGLAVSGQQGPAGRPDIEGIDEGFSQYLRLYWEAQELPTDEAVIGWGDIGLPEMNTQMWTQSNTFIIAMYYRIFFQVMMANEFLRQTTEEKLLARRMGPNERAQIQVFRAEARFLRALAYWHGMDLFGNIPIVTEATPVPSDPPQQSTRLEIYNFVVAELNEVRPQLPVANGSATYGRATDAAASMLLAHVYLNAEVYSGTPHWAEARAAAEAAIASSHTLDPNYLRMFRTDNNRSPEIIFPIIQDGKTTQTFGGMTFLVHASCGGSMDAAAYGHNGCWWGLRLKQQAYNRFTAGDIRSSYFYTTGQQVNVGNISDFAQGIPAPKYQNVSSTGAGGTDPNYSDTDFPVFRLADAYLIYAEAVVRGGGGTRATALGYINDLRERAFGNASGNIADADMTLDFILDERGRELLWEAHRRPDLIRFGRYTGGTYLWAFKGGVAAGTATEAFRDLYPIPFSELIANPNLEQNTGY
jgi:starch-binding outer membrane protein, SusD/RagB family